VVINKVLPCSPCNRAVCKGHECLESITIDEVFGAAQKQLVSIGSKQKRRFAAQRRSRKRERL
jgi:hypothetical protein